MDFVKIYSADWCHDCQAILSFFEKQNIDYKVINVDTDPKAIEKLKRLCGGKKIIPTLEINGKVYINPTIDTLTSMM